MEALLLLQFTPFIPYSSIQSKLFSSQRLQWHHQEILGTYTYTYKRIRWVGQLTYSVNFSSTYSVYYFRDLLDQGIIRPGRYLLFMMSTGLVTMEARIGGEYIYMY